MMQEILWEEISYERNQDRRSDSDRGRHSGACVCSFSYTKETHEAKIGPLEFQVKEKETVNVPVWAGVGAIVVGTVLLLVPLKR
jgi:hypothetical protein